MAPELIPWLMGGLFAANVLFLAVLTRGKKLGSDLRRLLSFLFNTIR